jgi:hypothetical protein
LVTDVNGATESAVSSTLVPSGQASATRSLEWRAVFGALLIAQVTSMVAFGMAMPFVPLYA